MPGVGEVTRADMVKREVIHQLCIASMAHSELTKALPEDVSIRPTVYCAYFCNGNG